MTTKPMTPAEAVEWLIKVNRLMIDDATWIPNVDLWRAALAALDGLGLHIYASRLKIGDQVWTHNGCDIRGRPLIDQREMLGPAKKPRPSARGGMKKDVDAERETYRKTVKNPFLCPDCDGCGWYEGGPTLMTSCDRCKGTGVIEDPYQGA